MTTRIIIQLIIIAFFGWITIAFNSSPVTAIITAIILVIFLIIKRRLSFTGLIFGHIFLYVGILMVYRIILVMIQNHAQYSLFNWVCVYLYGFGLIGLLYFAVPFLMMNIDMLGGATVPSQPKPVLDLNGNAPMISLHLAVSNEPSFVVIDTIKQIRKLDYPNFELIVLDNNTHKESDWKPVEQYIHKLSDERYRFFHFPQLDGFKGGALNICLEKMDPKASFFGIIDADTKVKSNWLRDTIGYFDDHRVAAVQAPQIYRYRNGLLHGIMYHEYNIVFETTMVQNDERNAIFLHGAMCLFRKKAVLDAGKWATWTMAEDFEMGFKLLTNGHSLVYHQDRIGYGELPETYQQYWGQRQRWSRAITLIFKRHYARFLGLKSTAMNIEQRMSYLIPVLMWELNILLPLFLIFMNGYIIFALFISANILAHSIYYLPALYYILCGHTLRYICYYHKNRHYNFWHVLLTPFLTVSLNRGIQTGVIQGIVSSRITSWFNTRKRPRKQNKDRFFIPFLFILTMQVIAVFVYVFQGIRIGLMYNMDFYTTIFVLLFLFMPYLLEVFFSFYPQEKNN